MLPSFKLFLYFCFTKHSYSFKEALGKTPRILKSGKQNRKFYKELWNTITAGKEWRGEFHNKNKNGELFWESASISQVKDEKGQVTHFVAVKEEITERKKTEEKLKKAYDEMESKVKERTADLKAAYDRLQREITNSEVADALIESEERLRAITSSARDAIIMIANDGKVTFWNPAAKRIFGYSSEEVVGKEPGKFIIPEEYRKKHKKGFEAFRKTGRGPIVNKTIELTGVRKNGENFPLELSIASIRLKKSWQAVGIIRDITERKGKG